MSDLLSRVNIEHFVLDIAAPLQAAPFIPGYVIELADEKTLNVSVPKSLGLNSLFAHLSLQGVTVSSLKNKSNRLEQLFIDLVQ